MLTCTERVREELAAARRWVIKIGSSLVTDDGRGLHHQRIHAWAEQISMLKRDGHAVTLVSSGAVAEGIRRLGWHQRPSRLHQIQAAAAVGQMGLVHAYEGGFCRHDLRVAQILLTHDDLTDRGRYLNARATLGALLKLDVIPIVNENDTVATDEIRFGDNDALAALVANLTDAEVMLILTDQEGLYNKDPRQFADGVLCEKCSVNDPRLDTIAGPDIGALGRGGMVTKISAARQAAISGTATVIASGYTQGVIQKIACGQQLGTWLTVDKRPLAARKQWISALKPAGIITIDAGAYQAVSAGSSLLPVGVCAAKGNFRRGEAVECHNQNGVAVAQGLINYSAGEAQQIIGKHSVAVMEIVGVGYEPEMIHRDNLTVIEPVSCIRVNVPV